VVTSTRRRSRRRYDSQSKRQLAQACLQPGVSLAGMALKHGVNASLLRKWVVNYQRASTSAAPQAVRALHRISEDVSEQLHIPPQTPWVWQHIRFK
jgi:transposase-like protein